METTHSSSGLENNIDNGMSHSLLNIHNLVPILSCSSFDLGKNTIESGFHRMSPYFYSFLVDMSPSFDNH